MPTRVKITARGNGKGAKKYPLVFGNDDDRPLHIPIAKNNCNGDHFSRQKLF